MIVDLRRMETWRGSRLTIGTRLWWCRLYCASGPITILQGILPSVPDDRRNRVPGGTFFFAVNLLDRRSNLLVTQIHMLRDALRQVPRHAPFRIDGWAVLPDHVHCLWTLPAGDADFPGCWRAIKTAFAKALPARESGSRSGGTGSTRSAMIETLRLTWTTRTSTRCS